MDIVDRDKNIVHVFARNIYFDDFKDELEDLLDKYAAKVSRAEIIGCLEYIKVDIMNR